MKNDYFLECIFDSRNSFYKKAKVKITKNKNVIDLELFSYNTLVARVIKIGDITSYYYFGNFSQTTTRHQKEFFKQEGLNGKKIKELFKKGKLIVKEEYLPF